MENETDILELLGFDVDFDTKGKAAP